MQLSEGFNPLRMRAAGVLKNLFTELRKVLKDQDNLASAFSLGNETPFAFRIPFSFKAVETPNPRDPEHVAHYIVVLNQRDV